LSPNEHAIEPFRARIRIPFSAGSPIKEGNDVRKTHGFVAAAIIAVASLGLGAVAWAHGNGRSINERLSGYEETPALSTPGHGEFRATIDKGAQEIRYRLTFGDLESDVMQAHIHFENATNPGPIVAFLCSNLGNGPAGTQPCPAAGGTITGTIRPADVTDMAATAGIGAGEFQEFVRAIRAGATYVNVHSTTHASGEIRAQLDDHDHSGRDH
jgi:hypothetical protein